MRRPLPRPTDTEVAILRVLWTRALKKLREELQEGPRLDEGLSHV